MIVTIFLSDSSDLMGKCRNDSVDREDQDRMLLYSSDGFAIATQRSISNRIVIRLSHSQRTTQS